MTEEVVEGTVEYTDVAKATKTEIVRSVWNPATMLAKSKPRLGSNESSPLNSGKLYFILNSQCDKLLYIGGPGLHTLPCATPSSLC